MLAVQGLRNRSDYEYDLMCRVTSIIAASGFNGKAAISRMKHALPLRNQRQKSTISPRTWDTIKRLREQDALLKAKAIKGANGNAA